MKCVLLSGGGGLRLWPLSRKYYPKQFLTFDGQESMFSKSIERNRPLFSDFTVITNEAYRYLTATELEKAMMDDCQVILESLARNTAPAIAIAALLSDPDEIIFVAPTDAVIQDMEAYHEAIKSALSLALQGFIVTFGIEPMSAHTGYGYIHHCGNDVLEFREKPDADTATRYLEAGDYLWNSGMFMFRASVLLDELATCRRDIFDACVDLVARINVDDRPIKLPEIPMAAIPAESIDYAVIEKSERIKVVPAHFYWNDMGGLEAFSDMAQADDAGNKVVGTNTIITGCSNTSIVNDAENVLVVVNYIQDVIVTNTNNAVYVTKRGSSEKIKQIIAARNDEYGRFFDENVRTYRPWGFYEILVNASHYKVKRITVFPGKRISLQRHFHRSEHWTIASGVATITLGTETADYATNQGAYIPIGVVHRLANNTDEPLEIIEVSLGEILSENEIERLEDDFER